MNKYLIWFPDKGETIDNARRYENFHIETTAARDYVELNWYKLDEPSFPNVNIVSASEDWKPIGPTFEVEIECIPVIEFNVSSFKKFPHP